MRLKTNAVPACPNCGMKGQGYKQQPQGYLVAHDWADSMLRAGYRQFQCSGCQDWTIWRKKQ